MGQRRGRCHRAPRRPCLHRLPCRARHEQCDHHKHLAISVAGNLSPDRTGLRIREWISRHGERCCHCHLALALGMGTMVGWKRIVVTVGEKIGKEHLTYAQGACAELVAMGTIMAADNFGLPVSTTHVLSSGVAGTMAANKSGLQVSTLRNIAAAWVFTLPAAALLSGSLFFLFRHIAG